MSFKEQFKQAVIDYNFSALQKLDKQRLKGCVDEKMFEFPHPKYCNRGIWQSFGSRYTSRKNKITALQYICFSVMSSVIPTFNKGKFKKIIEHLVDCGADLTQKHSSFAGMFNNTLLMESVSGESNMVWNNEWLFMILIDVAYRDDGRNRASLTIGDGFTDNVPERIPNPLFFALFAGRSDTLIISLINKMPIEALKATYEGSGLNILHLACFARRNKVIQALVKKAPYLIDVQDSCGLKPRDYYLSDSQFAQKVHINFDWLSIYPRCKFEGGQLSVYSDAGVPYSTFCSCGNDFGLFNLTEFRGKNKTANKDIMSVLCGENKSPVFAIEMKSQLDSFYRFLCNFISDHLMEINDSGLACTIYNCMDRADKINPMRVACSEKRLSQLYDKFVSVNIQIKKLSPFKAEKFANILEKALPEKKNTVFFDKKEDDDVEYGQGNKKTFEFNVK